MAELSEEQWLLPHLPTSYLLSPVHPSLPRISGVLGAMGADEYTFVFLFLILRCRTAEGAGSLQLP